MNDIELEFSCDCGNEYTGTAYVDLKELQIKLEKHDLVVIDRRRFDRLRFLAYAVPRFYEDNTDFKRLQDIGFALSSLQPGDSEDIPD